MEETKDITLEQALNEFYIAYSSTKMTSYPDKIVYHKIPFGFNEEMVREANDLIKNLRLPLIAVSNSSRNGLFNDTFVVKSNKTTTQ